MHDDIDFTPPRRQSFVAAQEKLEKYLLLMLEKDWGCTAFALDPFNRGEALKGILTAYGRASRYKKVEEWIVKRIEQHAVTAPPVAKAAVSASEKAKGDRRVSEFTTRKRNAATDPSNGVIDERELYNSEADSVNERNDESIPEYWRRMKFTNRLPAMSAVGRDVLGMQSSTTSVE